MMTIDQSVDISAPVQRVYQFCQHFERFPEFIGSIASIRRSGENMSHWAVRGPLRTTMEFDSLTTKQLENRLMAWHSVHEHNAVHSRSRAHQSAA